MLLAGGRRILYVLHSGINHEDYYRCPGINTTNTVVHLMNVLASVSLRARECFYTRHNLLLYIVCHERKICYKVFNESQGAS